MSKSRKLHQGIPEQLKSSLANPIQWKFGWSFERTIGGSVIIRKIDEATKAVVAEAAIPGNDWVKIVGGVSLKRDDGVCQGILKVIHS